MLMEEKIRKHKYFQAMRMKNDNILDPLTKTITRSSMISYVQYLLKNKRRFTLGILDLDNFKIINDTYGHQAGDEILKIASENIMASMPEDCSIGRYGGDEFMLVWEGIADYDSVWASLANIYRTGIRKPIHLSIGRTIGVTATTGTTSYPKDASSYDDLFLNCDKCLYRGKQKGRNCYIIYVEYLHSKIDIHQTAKKNMSERIMQLYDIFDKSEKRKKVQSAMRYLTNNISISGAAYIYKNKIKISYEKNVDYGLPPVFPEKYLEKLENNNFFYVNDYTTLQESEPDFCEFCHENNLLSFVVYKVLFGEKDYGYVLFYDSDFKRMWQDDDLSLFTIFVKTLGTICHFGNA